MILLRRTPTVVLYVRWSLGWIWECVAKRPWHQAWRAYRFHYVATVCIDAHRILERGAAKEQGRSPPTPESG